MPAARRIQNFEIWNVGTRNFSSSEFIEEVSGGTSVHGNSKFRFCITKVICKFIFTNDLVNFIQFQ
jgi:hypothetical protein